MNYRNMHSFIDLPECPICGMSGGKRMVTDSVPEKFYVVCEVCGFKTRPHPTQSAATKDWQSKRRKG